MTAARDGAVTVGARGTVALAATTDLEWTLDRPGATASLDISGDVSGDGGPTLRLEAADGRLVVGAPGLTAAMPIHSGRARVVLDGPVVEVVGDEGVLAVTVPGLTPRTCRVDGSAAVEAYPLA